MLPILATAAASTASDVILNIADRFAQGSAKTAPAAAPTVPFSSLIDKATLAARAQELSTRLSRSAEVAAAANQAGIAGPPSLQVDANGDASLRLPNGGVKSITLSAEMRGVARELYHLRHAGEASNTAPAPLGNTVSINRA